MRECSECKMKMKQRFVIENGMEYYCSEECLHKHYTEDEYLEMFDDGNGDSYWTVWEEEEEPKETIYILKVNYYKELAFSYTEYGANNILGVYKDKNICIEKLKEYLRTEIKNNHIIEGNKTIELVDKNLEELICNNTKTYFSGYMSQRDYDDGNSEFEYVIEEKELIY